MILGATQPGSGSTVPAESEQAPEKLSFKQQVGAWAHVNAPPWLNAIAVPRLTISFQIHHGKVTKKTEEKEHFEKVLAGQVAPPEGKNDTDYTSSQ